MPVAIAMLRGVNLGKRRIKMEALRALRESAGCSGAQTYIQSGNVVFRSKEKNMKKLTQKLESALEERFGFTVPVTLRSADEMRKVVEFHPFPERVLQEPGKVLVMFMNEDPGDARRKTVEAMNIEPEIVKLKGREFFIDYPMGQGVSKLRWPPIERALGTTWTGRNWTTVCKLLEMAETLERG